MTLTPEQLTQGLLAILPEILLLVLGFIVITSDLFMQRRANRRSLAYLSIAGLLGVLVVIGLQTVPLLSATAPAVQPVLGGMARIDLTVQLFRVMFVVAALLTCVISLDFNPVKHNGEYYGLLIFSTLGMGIMAGANDIIMLYVGLETTGIS